MKKPDLPLLAFAVVVIAAYWALFALAVHIAWPGEGWP